MKYWYAMLLTAMGIYLAWWSSHEMRHIYAALCFIVANMEVCHIQIMDKLR